LNHKKLINSSGQIFFMAWEVYCRATVVMAGEWFCRIYHKPAPAFFLLVLVPSAAFGQQSGSCSAEIPLADLVNVIGLSASIIAIAWLGRVTLKLLRS